MIMCLRCQCDGCVKCANKDRIRSGLIQDPTMSVDCTRIFVLLILATVLAPQGVTSLKLTRLSVPQYKLKGEMALLECHYEMGEDLVLYSLKWYKDDEEFYRYLPKHTPPQISYRVDGVKVDHHLSDNKQVALRNLNLKSSGIYKCEVSAEAPSFASVQRESPMEVVFLPKDGPHITGEEKQYQIGDEMNLNCTSGKSHPVSLLHWYINEKQVTNSDLLIEYPPVVHLHGLLSSSLGLRFTVSSRHFLGGDMRVRCLARVSPVLWEGDKESVVARVEPLANNIREAFLLVKGLSSHCSASIGVVLLLASASLWMTRVT